MIETTMNFLLFCSFFLLNSCFAEKSFFDEIDKKPKAEQNRLLERRLQFAIKKGLDLKTDDTVKAYLHLSHEKDKKIGFILSLINNGENGGEKSLDIKRKILSSTIRFCKKSQRIPLLEALLKIKKPEIFDKNLRAEIFGLLRFRNYSPVVANSSFIIHFFDELIRDDKKNLKRVLALAQKYGMYQYLDKKIIKYKKEFGSKVWFKYRECLSLIRDQYEKSKTCFEKVQGPWFKFGSIYSDFLQGKKLRIRLWKSLVLCLVTVTKNNPGL